MAATNALQRSLLTEILLQQTVLHRQSNERRGNVVGSRQARRHRIGFILIGAGENERVRVEPDADLVWTYLTRADLDEAELEPGDADDLIDLVRTAREADVAAVVKQQRDGRFKVSLRSRGGHDVAAAAARFGGGGYRLASGYTSSQGLVATVESLKDALGAEPRPGPSAA